MIDSQEFQEQLELQRKVQALETLVKNYLEKDAVTRYSNIKAVNAEKALQILGVMKNLIQSGRIKNKLSDNEFKSILQMLQEPKREFRIKRV